MRDHRPDIRLGVIKERRQEEDACKFSSQGAGLKIGMREVFVGLARVSGEEPVDTPRPPVAHADAAKVAPGLGPDHLMRAVTARYRAAKPIHCLGCSPGAAHRTCHRHPHFLCRHAGVLHRTDGRALRRVKVSFTLGAFGRINDVDVAFEANGGVGALELASAANGAL